MEPTLIYQEGGVSFYATNLPVSSHSLIVQGITALDSAIVRGYQGQVSQVNIIGYIGESNGANPSVWANSTGPASDWVRFPDPLPDSPGAKFLTYPMVRTRGVDTVYVSLDVGDASPYVQRLDRNLAGTSTHEMFHGSKMVNSAAQVGLALERILDPNLNISGQNERTLLGIFEHVVIARYLEQVALETGGRVLVTDTASLAVYQNAFQLALEELRRTGGIVNPDILRYAGSTSRIIQISDFEEKGVQSAHAGASDLNVINRFDNGGIATYVNQNGQVVSVAEGTRYTDNMLNTYRTEWVNRDGVLEGGMTFGATVRAFGDWLGFDGELGIQGNFARDGEGSAAAGPGAGGAGGNTGAASSGSNHDDDRSGRVTIITGGTPDPNKLVITNGGLKDHTATENRRPILLDLDGNGVQITELDRSTVFMDASGSGLRHRTAWAGAGDDLTALRSRFDTNCDRKPDRHRFERLQGDGHLGQWRADRKAWPASGSP